MHRHQTLQAARHANPALPSRRCLLASLAAAALPWHPVHAAPYVPQPLPKGETRTVVLGVGGTDSEPAYLGIWAALYGGYFERLRVDGVIVNVIPFPGGGADAILGLTSGRTNINYQSAENAVRAQAQGRDATIIYNAMPTAGVFIMARKGLESRVKTIADVKGLRWGVTAFGASGHTDSMRAARYGGVDPSQISWLALGGQAGLLPSVREGRVDIFVATAQARALMLQQGIAYDLLDMFHPEMIQKIYGHGMLGLGLLSSRAWCDANSFAAFKVVEAVHRAIADAQKTPPEKLAAELPAQFQSPVLASTLETTLQGFSADGISSPDDVGKMIADLYALKLIAKQVDPAVVVDNRFAEAVKAG